MPPNAKPPYTPQARARALQMRSRMLISLDRLDEALADLDRALEVDPHNAITHYDRGRVLSKLNRATEATLSHRQAVAAHAAHADARFAACLAELPIIYEDELEIARRRGIFERELRALCAEAEAGRVPGDLVNAIAVNQPFLLAYQGLDNRALRSLYGSLACRAAQAFPTAPLPLPRSPGEPVRVGIVSAFFHMHANWQIPIRGWLGQLDRERFELFGYHVGIRRDAETEVAAALCHKFERGPLTAKGWRDAILGDAPHVIIYPGLSMDNISCTLAAQRLAPVQCVSWGHPETSGLPTVDYFLSSDVMEPADAQAHYTEKLVRLPNLSVYCEPMDPPPQTARAELGLSADAIAFWCGQSLYKYLPQYDLVFPRIAKQLPASRFVFIRHEGAGQITELFQRRLGRAFAAEGLRAEDYCVFLPRLSVERYIGAMGQCDIFLDSIGWSGCNSTMQSLTHDLPIVTLPGVLMRARHSAAILQMMGVTETIARSLDDYVSIAGSLGADPAKRQAIRGEIAAGKHRVYRDRACIAALEDFLECAATPSEPKLK